MDGILLLFWVVFAPRAIGQLCWKILTGREWPVWKPEYAGVPCGPRWKELEL